MRYSACRGGGLLRDTVSSAAQTQHQKLNASAAHRRQASSEAALGNTLADGDAMLKAQAPAQKHPASQRVSSCRLTETRALQRCGRLAGRRRRLRLATCRLALLSLSGAQTTPLWLAAAAAFAVSNVQHQQTSMALPQEGRHHNELRLELVSSACERFSFFTPSLQHLSVGAAGALVGAGVRHLHRTRGSGGGGVGGTGAVASGQQQGSGGHLLTFASELVLARPFAVNNSLLLCFVSDRLHLFLISAFQQYHFFCIYNKGV